MYHISIMFKADLQKKTAYPVFHISKQFSKFLLLKKLINKYEPASYVLYKN